MGPGVLERSIVLVVACLVLLWTAGYAQALEPRALAITVQALCTAGLFALLAFGLASLRPGPPGHVVGRLGLGPGRLPAGSVAALAVGTLAVSNAAEIAIRLLGLEGVGTLADVDQALAGSRGLLLAAALVAVALGAGACEELFFRGWLQRGLERRLPGAGGAAAALVLASAAFAAAHWDPVHSPAAFVLGLYLGGVARLADGVRAAIACHVLNNAAAVLEAAFGYGIPGPAWLALVLDLLLAGGALLLAWRTRRPPGNGSPTAPSAVGRPEPA